MKVRTLKRAMSRRWDSVHSSWEAVLDHEYMWPIRKAKGCKAYTAWCSNCNAKLFPEVKGRFPRSVVEFNLFEQLQQDKETKHCGACNTTSLESEWLPDAPGGWPRCPNCTMC